jgi:hypothetical protein
MDTETGVAVAAAAAIVSPRARNLLRRGAVYGLAGALKAGDVVYGAARGAVRGAADGVSGNGSRPSRSASSPQRSASRARASSRSRSKTTRNG